MIKLNQFGFDITEVIKILVIFIGVIMTDNQTTMSIKKFMTCFSRILNLQKISRNSILNFLEVCQVSLSVMINIYTRIFDLNRKLYMSFSTHFLFFILVDQVTKNENRLGDFLYNVFHLQRKTGETK